MMDNGAATMTKDDKCQYANDAIIITIDHGQMHTSAGRAELMIRWEKRKTALYKGIH